MYIGAPEHRPSSKPYGGSPPYGSTSSYGGSSYCSTGPVQCCNSMTDSSDPFAKLVADAAGADLGEVGGPVGMGCSPLADIGDGGW